jgi:hypothetical protein
MSKKIEKPYKKLLGNRIYLLFEQEESPVIVDENTKIALQEAFAKKMLRAKVYDVGTTVLDIKKNEEVLVDPKALQNASVIPLGDINVLLVSPFDVVHVW